jgi:hypothetical protein
MTDVKDDVLEVAKYFNGLTLYSPDSQMVPAAMSHVRVTLPLALAMQECIRSMADRLTTLTRERDEARSLCDETINLFHFRDADREADTLRTQLAAARTVTARLNGVIEWMLGENGEFPVRPNRFGCKPYPMYYWRSELRARRDAALTAALTQEAP